MLETFILKEDSPWVVREGITRSLRDVASVFLLHRYSSPSLGDRYEVAFILGIRFNRVLHRKVEIPCGQDKLGSLVKGDLLRGRDSQ